MSSNFRRGTGGPGGSPLKEYGKPNTFGLAVAEKLAVSGLTEAEYVQIAQKFNTDVKRFKDYIRYFKDERFNIVLENGRYVDKTEPSNSSYSSTLTQVASNGEIPTREDIENILSGIAPKKIEVDEEALKHAIEFSFASEKRKLKLDWWKITKKNLVEWSKKG